MKILHVFNVGDGLCVSIKTFSGKTFQIDWGSRQGGKKAFFKPYEFYPFYNPDTFVLSHFHFDHYNALTFASLSCCPYSFPFEIREVYFPRIPDFKDKDEFMKCLIAMNIFLFGNESGVMGYDFLMAISIMNKGRKFYKKPLSKGDKIEFFDLDFEVLWPPRSLSEEDEIPKIVKKAIDSFRKASEKHDDLKEIYNLVNEEGIFKHYYEKGKFEEPKEWKPQIIERKELPDDVRKANENLRKAANHLSLAFFETRNQILFLGDLENKEIKQVVDFLKNKNNKKLFYIFITPHHGTHWDNSLGNIQAFYSILSCGSELFNNMKQKKFEQISNFTLSTYQKGDITIPFDFFYSYCCL
jgi:beta-lactamase superfamily II metal-dependent hydrolase